MGLGTHRLQRSGHGLMEVGHIGWDEVRQVPVLAIAPHPFCGVEIKRIRRQPLHLQPIRMAFQQHPHRLAVHTVAIQHQGELAPQVPSQRGEEVDHLLRADVLSIHLEIEPGSATHGRERHPRDHRQAVVPVPTGVHRGFPRGAQVRRTTGWSMNPLSSIKTMGQPWLRDFFDLWPPVLPPTSDRLLVSLPSTPLRLLATPPHAPQNPPDLRWVVPHAKRPLDHLGHPSQRPELRGEASSPCPSQEDAFQLLELVGRQPRRAPGVGFGSEGLHPPFFQFPFPPRHRRRRSTHQAGHFTDALALQEQVGRDPMTLFQRFSTAFWSYGIMISHVLFFPKIKVQ